MSRSTTSPAPPSADNGVPWRLATILGALVTLLAIVHWPRLPPEIAKHRLDAAAIAALPGDGSGDELLLRHIGSLLDSPHDRMHLPTLHQHLLVILTFEQAVISAGFQTAYFMQQIQPEVTNMDLVVEGYRALESGVLADRLERHHRAALASHLSRADVEAIETLLPSAIAAARRHRLQLYQHHADLLARGY